MNNDVCELKKYIDDSLNQYYTFVNDLSDSPFTKVSSYLHKKSGNKIILISSLNRNDKIYRLIKEISSPHLPKIDVVCSEDDRLYVLEEFIEGNTLSAEMMESQIDTKVACKYICDVCEALSQLHKKNIIHRDVKPANIIISKDRAVLVDFDIARLKNDDSDNKDTENLGTVNYAAPEQFGIHQSNQATDIYPLGIILNELIVGVHPAIDTPPGKLGKIIDRCITTQMSKRYQDTETLKKDLVKFTR